MYPDKGRLGVSRPDRRGRCPLYYAVRYDAPPGVVSLLLEVGPSAVLEEDQNAESPLALIWNSWAKKTENQQILQKIVGVVDENAPLVERADQVGKRLKARPKILDRWNKVNSFLKAAFGFELDDDWEFVGDSPSEEKKDSPSRDERSTPRERKWRILHAVSSIKCHHSLFKLACALHPEQAEELDQNDLRRIDDKQSIIPPSKCIPQRLRGPTNVSSLHLACSSGANGDAGKHVIVQLLAMYPAASQFTDSEGSTSLHRIAENVHKASWTQDGAEEIYIAHPEAVRVADVNGQFPLHRAAKAISYAWGGISEDEIRERSKICRLLQANEEASHQADHMGCLPLHYVAEYGVSWDLQVQALYDANTAAVQTRAGVKCYNRLPIHMAAANPKADFTLISKLVELNPRATGQSDRMGKLPLHLACEAGHCWETIECILNAHDGAVEEREENQRGWKALHIAAYSHRADGEVLSNLTRLHPEAAGISDRQGRFPLHLACLSDKAWHDGLSDLFDAYPEAIRTPDAMGLLPLHIMSFRYSPKPDNENEETPKVIDLQSRNPSRSVGTEPTQPTKEELRDATEIANLFNLIKADPTVLDGIY
jgi:ankyrin repeat protein